MHKAKGMEQRAWGMEQRAWGMEQRTPKEGKEVEAEAKIGSFRIEIGG